LKSARPGALERPAMTDTQHILLESDDRTVPERRAARKVHAQYAFRSRLRNRALQLDIIDFYYLSVKIQRGRSRASEYVLDLRFVDPALHVSRHIAWGWIAATLIAAAVACASLSCVSSPPLWSRHEWTPICAGLFGLALSALVVCIYRTTETLVLSSTHGRARLLHFTGRIGMTKALRPFVTKLGAHIRVAMTARRSVRVQHLRDEMREHFRLKEIGVLAYEEYDASKTRILAAHAAK
jgi:hypothetical protein